MSVDRYDLERFVAAQDPVWDRVRAELARAGRRATGCGSRSRQLAGLGSSSTARAYAVSGLDEAQAYLAHPVLGPRLRRPPSWRPPWRRARRRRCSAIPTTSSSDASMTLFARAAPQDPVFTAVLDRYFGGDPDPRTIELLG